MMRRVAAVVLVAGVAAWLVAAPAAPASAHALLQSSRPAANATVASAPRQLSLTFTEPPDPSLSVVQLLGSTGASVSLGRPQVSGRTIVVPVTGPVPDGTYTVNWRVVSRTDGHVTAGSFAFGVGEAPTIHPGGSGATAGSSAFPSALSVVAKWLLYVGLSLGLAGAVVGIAVLRRDPPPAWPLAAGGVATVAGWVGLVASEGSVIGVGVGTFLRTASGRPFAWLGVACALVLLLSAAAALARRAALWWATAVAAGGAMLVRSIGGHADAGRFPALEIAAQLAHLAAVGVWIGGLAWLLLSIPTIAPPERSTYVRRFSTTAGVALGVVAATGALRAVDELGGVTHLGRLFSTDYGWTLVAKMAVSVALVVAGAFNRYVNVPRSANGAGGRASLTRVVTTELVLAAGLFGLTGLLTGLPPAAANAPAHASHAHDVVVNGADFATTVRTRLVVMPGTVGSNRFELRVVDYDTGRPVDATRVTLQFTAVSNATLAPSTMSLQRTGPGEWSGTGAQISIDDRWRLVATIQTTTGSTQVPMELSPRVPSGHTTVSSAPGQPSLYTSSFADGTSIQMYVDPGAPGADQLHATAFDPQGNELPLRSVSLIAVPPSGASQALQPQRFSPGHFAANVQLTAGLWTFEVRTVSTSGDAFDAHFTQRIQAGGQG